MGLGFVYCLGFFFSGVYCFGLFFIVLFTALPYLSTVVSMVLACLRCFVFCLACSFPGLSIASADCFGGLFVPALPVLACET